MNRQLAYEFLQRMQIRSYEEMGVYPMVQQSVLDKIDNNFDNIAYDDFYRDNIEDVINNYNIFASEYIERLGSGALFGDQYKIILEEILSDIEIRSQDDQDDRVKDDDADSKSDSHDDNLRKIWNKSMSTEFEHPVYYRIMLLVDLEL